MTKPSWRAWYDKLKKPEYTPKPQTIGLIWTILYPIIALSFGYTFFQVYSGNWPQYVALPFFVNLVANLLFSPILFRLRNLMVATIDIIVVWVTIH